MAVAKSFQSMELCGNPYAAGNKMYIKIRNPKTGTVRQVRWYTDAEYAKMYPEEKIVDPFYRTQKDTLGFEAGFITIFKGDTERFSDYLRFLGARYTRWWGWYLPSAITVPTDLPPALTPVQLPWDLVGQNNSILKTETLVLEAVDSLINESSESASTYQGVIGERLSLDLLVIKTAKRNSDYGTYTQHTFEDASGNQYLWETTAKSWEVGEKHAIKATVKNHEMRKGVQTTVLTRCLERK